MPISPFRESFNSSAEIFLPEVYALSIKYSANNRQFNLSLIIEGECVIWPAEIFIYDPRRSLLLPPSSLAHRVTTTRTT